MKLLSKTFMQIFAILKPVFYFCEKLRFQLLLLWQPFSFYNALLKFWSCVFFIFDLNFQETCFKIFFLLFIFVKVIKFVPDFSKFLFPFSETLACIISIFWNICYASFHLVLLTQVTVWFLFMSTDFFSESMLCTPL